MNGVTVNLNNHDETPMYYNEVWFNSFVLCSASDKYRQRSKRNANRFECSV